MRKGREWVGGTGGGGWVVVVVVVRGNFKLSSLVFASRVI